MYVALQSSTCFEHQHAHLQEDKLYLSQHLVSSLSVLYSCSQRVTIPDAVTNTICPPEDGHVEGRNMSRIVMQHTYCYRIKELCIKLVIEISLYKTLK
jgi:hypothetical protein